MHKKDEGDWNRTQEGNRALAYSTYNLSPGIIEHDRIQRQYLIGRSSYGYVSNQDITIPTEEYQFKRHYEAYPYYYNKYYEHYPYSLPPEKYSEMQPNHQFAMRDPVDQQVISNRSFLDNKPPRTFTTTFHLLYKGGQVNQNGEIDIKPYKQIKERNKDIPEQVMPTNYMSFERYGERKDLDSSLKTLSQQSTIQHCSQEIDAATRNGQFYTEESDKRILKKLLNQPQWLQSKDHVLHIFTEILQYEKELEEMRKNLFQQPDFDINSLFKFFDHESLGKVTAFDLDKGVKQIAIFPEKKDLYLFIIRYSQSEDPSDTLSKKEFIEAIQPSQPLDKKEEKDVQKIVNFKEVSDLTKQLTTKLFKMIIRQENAIEYLASEIIERRYDLADLFRQFDTKRLSTIECYDLIEWIRKHRIYANQYQFNKFISRFDRFETGEISLKQFQKELSPKNIFIPKRRKEDHD